MPASAADLMDHIERACDGALRRAVRVAVAVSGGPDSMALCRALTGWAQEHEGLEVHALHVDHGLRAESEQEVRWLEESLQGVTFALLKWEGDKPKARVQEEARAARYDLMARYCREHDIEYLFLAHHEDDQAETFLFRLAKGSGLDGLGAMAACSDYDENLTLVRPFLEVPKAELIRFCDENDVPYLQDPSNENEIFARVRLRQARAVLEKEGLSSKRLSNTAKRLVRARFALDSVAEDAYKALAQEKTTKRIVLNLKEWRAQPDEIGLRVLQNAMNDLAGVEGYGPRLERVESLFADMRAVQSFRKRTLGGIIFERDDKRGVIILMKEKGEF